MGKILKKNTPFTIVEQHYTWSEFLLVAVPSFVVLLVWTVFRLGAFNG